ncbi:MAG TPA: Ig-like domain-containing protein [Myxococcales bacterium]
MGFLRSFAAVLCCGSSAFAAQVRSSQPLGAQPRVPTQVAGTNAPTCPLAACRLRYYGGKVIPNVKVYQVNWTAAGQRDMSAFFGAVTSSSYLDWLNEYSTNIPVQAGGRLGTQGSGQFVGRGVFAGSFTITPSAANAGGAQQCGGAIATNCCQPDVTPSAGTVCIADSQISDELRRQIAAGQLPPPDENTLYFVYFPAGIVTSLQGHSACVAGGFCGYHSTYADPVSRQSVYYAVMPSHENGSGCELGCGDQTLTSAFDKISETSSHELAEAITDPEVGIGQFVDFPLGWYDPNNAEIADICDRSPHVTVNGFVVETLFSNKVSATAPTAACVAQRFDATDFAVSIVPNHAAVAAGSSVAVSISTSIASGGAQTLNLSVANLPAGVTATLDQPTVSAGSPSTLTLTAAPASTPRQDAVVQLKAENGSVTHTAGLLLQLMATPAANDFSIALSPAAQSVTAGKSVAYTVTTALTNGSAETIHLTVAGLPPGVAASFASTQAPTADITTGTIDTLTLSAAAGTAATPATTFTVDGTTPSVPAGHPASATLAVAVAADFALNLPAGIAVPRGSSNTMVVQTAVLAGSPQPVDLSAVGLPAGVSASFVPAHVPPGANSILTVSADTSAHLSSNGRLFTVLAGSTDAVHTRDVVLTVTGSPGVPVVAIARPAAGSVSGTVEIDVSASPATGANLAQIEVFVDGNSVGTSHTSPAQIFWPSAQVLDGTHALTARATDDDGGTATTGPIALTVLNSASSAVSGTAPAHGGCASGGVPSALALLGLFFLRPSRRSKRTS